MELTLFFNLVLGCAIMVWVPLALAHVEARFRPGGGAAFWLLRAAALAGFVSLFLRPGEPPALLAGAAWVLVCFYAGVAGVRRLAFRGLTGGARSAAAYALIGLAGAGVWFAAARTSRPFLGFDEPWKSLTSIHFHYAAALVPLAYALMFARLEDRGKRMESRLGAAALALWFVGFAAVATGLNGAPLFEKIGAALMALAGAVLIAVSLRGRAEVARGFASGALLLLSALAGTASLTLAVLYAFKIGALAEFSAMAATHGVLNAFVWTPALLFLAVMNAWSVAEPDERLPFARWAAGARVGAEFFAPHTVPGKVRGLTDDFRELAREDFDADRVDADVRDFYERTADYELDVRAAPAPLFAGLWRSMVGPWFARREQLHLPDRDKLLAGRLVRLNEERDGRANPRGWIRTDRASGRAVYVAAYALHRRRDASYMNIAFPLPFGNMTSILLPVHHPVKPGGLSLTTLRAPRAFGDQGVFAVIGGRGLRLPLNETIDVWRDGGVLRAEHRMWFGGWPYLTLDYEMRRKE